jgi:hypothetical protein
MSSAFEPASVNTPPPPPTRSTTGDPEIHSHGNPVAGGPLRSLMATRRNVAHWLFPRDCLTDPPSREQPRRRSWWKFLTE